MIEQYSHKLTNSLFMWFDNFLLTKGQAYSNLTGTFFNYTDPRTNSSYKTFGSAYKQWVYDSSVTGATIPSGIYVNGSFQSRSNGINIDFENGRVLSTGLSTNANITGSFAVKDFNIYFTNETEEDLIIEKQFEKNSRIIQEVEIYIIPYAECIPAIFISIEGAQNKGFALGGMEETTTMAKAVILAEDSYQLDGVLSIFADSRNEVFPLLSMSQHPYNEFNDLKTGYYSYKALKNQYPNSPLLYINNAKTSKLTDKARKSLANDMYVGFIDFEIQQHRYRN